MHEMRVMSAHREPDVVADYARNAQMRGLKRHHRGRRPLGCTARRGRRAHRAAGHRRPAHQLALGGGRPRRPAVGRPDAPGRAGRLREPRRRAQRRGAGGAHPRDRVIARYTRPEMGALWTDEARMETWRQVEVAAAEEAEGPTAEDLDAIRAATFTVEAVSEREKVTDHDVAAFVDVLAESAGPAGRWIHFGLTSSDVLDTALALQLRGAGEILLTGAQRAGRGAGGRGAQAPRPRVRRAHPRRPRRADDLRDQARGLRVGGPPQRRAPARRRSPRRRSARSRARSAPTPRRAPTTSCACSGASGSRPSPPPPRSCRATATPRC